MPTEVRESSGPAAVFWSRLFCIGRVQERIVRPLTAFILASLCALPAGAQSYLTATGTPSFAAPEPVELGFVDASNGSLHLSIPVGSYPQRGTSQPLSIALEYDSSIWTPYDNGATVQWEPNNSLGGYFNLGGWYWSYEASEWLPNMDVVQGCWTDSYWTDKNGTIHVFHLNMSGNTGCPSSADAFAADSSGYHMYQTSTNETVYAPDGTLACQAPASRDPQGNYIQSEDSNGNYLSTPSSAIGGIIDTLGRQTVSGGLGVGSEATVSTSKGTSQYSFSMTTINVNTNFQESGVLENSTQLSVLRSVTLPDQSIYYFTYDCDESSGNSACGSPSGQSAYYGELLSITLPTGGTASYTYETFSDAYGSKSQWVHTRSSAGGSWTYTPQVLSHCSATQVNCQQQTTVNDPNGKTVYTFQLNNGAWPIEVERDDWYGRMMSTISNTWDFSQACVLIGCHGASFVRLSNEQTTVPVPSGNLTKQVSYSYDSPQTGNQTSIKEWKFLPTGNSFPSVPDRAKYISYLTTGTNDINKPTGVTQCNNSGSDSACPGGGSRVSQTLLTYDSYSSGLTTVTGVIHHDDTVDAGHTARGNVTEVSRWVSGSNYLNTFYTYDTTGQVLSEEDPAGNFTYYHYSDNFYTDPGNGNGPTSYTPQQPTNAYVTSVTDPLGTQTEGYYFGSGKAAISTDYNGAVTTYHFQDGLDRPTEEIDPVGWKLATYSSTTQADSYAAVGDASPSTGCVSCQHTEAILDSWGRTASNSLMNPAPTCSSPLEVDYTYDSDGRLYQQSHPYCGSGDPNHVLDQFGYDGLDRVSAIIHPDGEDLLTNYGAQVGSEAASQQGSPSIYGYGYPELSIDESSHMKQEWLDGFGRIVEVDEPNLAAPPAGTVQITGYEQSIWTPYGTTYDYGNVELTINSRNYYASYGENDTDSSIASQLAAEISGDSGAQVTAAVSGSSIILTGKSPGTYSYSFSSNTFDPNDFYSPSFYGNPQGGSLSSINDSLTDSPVPTYYVYDAGDHLTQVIQGVQTRTFAYDGLGRKISETTPEGGTVTYSYNISGGGVCSGDPSNVCQRSDARGVVTTFTYNSANQLTGVAYSIPGGESISAMPNACTTTPNGTSANVCYYYGQGGAQAYAIGRLTEMVDPTGSETYSHNAEGWVTQVSKVVNGQTYNVGYQFDPGGNVTQITYPSGRVVQQAYFSAGSLCEIAATASGCNGSNYYASGFSYNGPGKLFGFTYGNGVAATFGYSANRTQLSSLTYTKGSSTYFNQQYWYKQDSQSCPNGTSGNNGSIQCITDLVDSGRTVNYGYDLLGRMISAKTNGSTGFPQWGMIESYDRFGNRWDQTATAGSVPQPQLTFGTNGMNSSTTNRPNGYTFDPSGNMTVEPFSPPNDMTYDGENRMTAFSGAGGAATYTYDGNGLRVIKSVSGGATTVSIFSGNSVIAEYDNGAAPSAPSREYVYNGAPLGNTTGLLAMISSGATTYYHQDDESVRLTTDGNGNVVTQEGTFPFGETWYMTGQSNKWVFTSYNQDSESGLDYALARYYDSRTGTFCSADPLAGSPDDPQSWNRYPYGRNDPVDMVDPSGKNWFFSLMQDIGLALAPFTGGATLPMAEAGGIMNGFDSLTNGQPPWGFGSFGGGMALGSSWNGTPIMPYGGLTNGIQRALGLPTMADLGPMFEAKKSSNASNPCAGASPSQLDYLTPRFYGSEGRVMTPVQHIFEGHVTSVGYPPDPFTNDPVQTRYVSNSESPGLTLAQAIGFNANTFANPATVTVQANGNIRFTSYYPRIRLMTPFGVLTRYGIGMDSAGNWLHTNVLVVNPDCTHVVTSYPTWP